MRILWLSFLVSLFFTTLADALPFKCDKPQNYCEVETKRLTIGDKLGVFSTDGQLVAIGEVSEIRSRSRTVKILKKWGLLYRSYEMEPIDDEKANNPERFFQILTPLPNLAWGVNLGAINLGIGDSFLGTALEGSLYWWLWKDFYLTGRIHYIRGAGTASDNLRGADTQSVSVSSYGATIGMSELLSFFQLIAIRLDGDLGVSNASINLPGNFKKSEILNDRIDDGIGLYLRLGAAAIWRRNGIQPEIGFNFIRLQGSNNPALYIGISAPIN